MAKKNTIAGPSMTEQRRWQAEDDLRTLRRAEEIRADKSRVAMAQKMAQQGGGMASPRAACFPGASASPSRRTTPRMISRG